MLKVALNTINLNLIFNFSWFWLSCFRLFILVTPKDWIICLSNLLTLSIPDEGYSRNVSYTLNEMPTFLFLKHTFVLYFPSFLQVCKIDQPEFQHDIFNLMLWSRIVDMEWIKMDVYWEIPILNIYKFLLI